MALDQRVRHFSFYYTFIYQGIMQTFQQNYFIYILIIKMSSAEIDKIITKYENRQLPHKFQLQSTKRKGNPTSKKDQHMVTFMDHSSTPSKDAQSVYGHTDRSNYPNNNQLTITLRQLDQTQKKLAISQRNYAEMCRKYEKIKVLSSSLEIQLQKQRKSRLQQLIDLQNKLLLLQTQNDKTTKIIISKQDTIAILKEKLFQKDNQIVIFEQQLDEISSKLHQTINHRAYQNQQSFRNSLSKLQIDKANTILHFRDKNKQQVSILKRQIQKFDCIILGKQKQKQKILEQVQQYTKNNNLQINQLRDALVVNQNNYRKWLDQAKKQKLELIQKYQAQIQHLYQSEYQQQTLKSEHKYKEISNVKNLLEPLQVEVTQLQASNNYKQSQVQSLTHQNKKAISKVNQLELKVTHLKNQYVEQMQESQRLLSKLMEQEEENKILRQKNYALEKQNADLISKNSVFQNNSAMIKKQNMGLKIEIGRLQNKEQEKLTDRTQRDLNINQKLTQTSLKLKKKINIMESQIQNLTTELYAQRLNSAKLKQQVRESKQELKRQYQLSLENTKRELIEQVRTAKQKQNPEDFQKQKIYLQMFEIQRKYQMLKSQVVTVDEMSRTVNKIQRFHSRKK